MASVLIYMWMHHTLQVSALSYLLQVHFTYFGKEHIYSPGYSASILE